MSETPPTPERTPRSPISRSSERDETISRNRNPETRTPASPVGLASAGTPDVETPDVDPFAYLPDVDSDGTRDALETLRTIPGGATIVASLRSSDARAREAAERAEDLAERLTIATAPREGDLRAPTFAEAFRAKLTGTSLVAGTVTSVRPAPGVAAVTVYSRGLAGVYGKVYATRSVEIYRLAGPADVAVGPLPALPDGFAFSLPEGYALDETGTPVSADGTPLRTYPDASGDLGRFPSLGFANAYGGVYYAERPKNPRKAKSAETAETPADETADETADVETAETAAPEPVPSA